MRVNLFLVVCCFICAGCIKDVVVDESSEEETESITSLPFQDLDLTTSSEFKTPGANWTIVGQATADFQVEKDLQTKEGSGVLANLPTENSKDNLFSNWEHADLEIELEVLVPKGSNSGIYLQSRYEVQILDSWGVEKPRFADLGGIYQRWNEEAPEGKKGYEGHAPALNMAKAPGLWQKFYILFRAPRFDANGNKTANARFEKVILNGKVIHENVELTGPTRASAADDEVATAPLMLQGDHGPVAFRNIRYKRYFDEVLTVENIQYNFYDLVHPLNQLPDFDTMAVTSTGQTDSFNVTSLSPLQDRFGFRFTGTLNVPKTGDYIIKVMSDDGSRLYLDDKLLIDHNFNHDLLPPRSAFVALSEGQYDFQLDYYNNTWGKGLAIVFEGPEMEEQALASELPAYLGRTPAPLVLTPNGSPDLVRCFTNFGDEKRTHVLAVGNPEGVHYAVDLKEGTLLKFWRGKFADVANMWRGRGISQLMIPLALAVEGSSGPIAAQLINGETAYPEGKEERLLMDRYELDAAGVPTFYYNLGQAVVSDRYEVNVSDKTLSRIVSLTPGSGNEKIYSRLAYGDYIEKMPNDYYNIGGAYYLKVEDETGVEEIRNMDGKSELLISADASSGPRSVKYRLQW